MSLPAEFRDLSRTVHVTPWPDPVIDAVGHDARSPYVERFWKYSSYGGWNDPKMPRYYTRELAAKDSGMARMVRARGEKEPSRS